jgi:hypothetical protein
MLYISHTVPEATAGMASTAIMKAWRMARRTVTRHGYIGRRPKPRARWNSASIIPPRPSSTPLERERTWDSRTARPAPKTLSNSRCLSMVAFIPMCKCEHVHRSGRNVGET